MLNYTCSAVLPVEDGVRVLTAQNSPDTQVSLELAGRVRVAEDIEWVVRK